MTADQIEQATQRDPVLSKVWHYTKNGGAWQLNDELKPYWNRRQELSVQGGCVTWGIRVVVPETLREELQSGHQGVVRMKAKARELCVVGQAFGESSEELSRMSGGQEHAGSGAASPMGIAGPVKGCFWSL